MIHFTENDIAEIKESVSIEDILENYGIEKHGTKYICPFHDDHDPSLAISKKGDRCVCYVCNQSWDIIQFVKEYENKSFTESMITLIKISGGNIRQYMTEDIKLPNIRRLKIEERILLGFDEGKELVTVPMKPIKKWRIDREGDVIPNYNGEAATSYYDGYLELQKPKLTENYIYTHYPEVYRSMVLQKLELAIKKAKFLYEQGENVSKQIAMLNKLKKDFGYSNKKTQS